jgi:hypothetical protein
MVRLKLALEAVYETGTAGGLQRDPVTGEEFYVIPAEAMEGLRVAHERVLKSTEGGN